MNTSKYCVGKTYISRTNPEDTIKCVTESALNGAGGYICVSNLRTVLFAGKDESYRQLMRESYMNWPDGTPLSWCGKAWGLKEVGCTRGPDIFQEMMRSGDKGLKHFLFGDTQEVLDQIVARYGKTANIVGVYSPPFAPLEEYDLDAMEQMIRESGANIVWTAMTAPKQDYFDQIMAKRLPQVLFIGVGRAFRISVGIVKDAPEWAQKSGLGGLFISKKKPLARVWSAFRRSFILMGLLFDICWKRLRGVKYYE